MNSSDYSPGFFAANFGFFFGKVARESGHEQLWTELTTALDEQLAAISEAGSRERHILDSEGATLDQIETRIATYYQQLRAAAENDLMALYLLSHSRAGDLKPMTFDQQFEIAGRLRQMAEQCASTESDWSKMARLIADGLESDLQFYLYLDTDSENALAQEVYELGGSRDPDNMEGMAVSTPDCAVATEAN